MPVKTTAGFDVRTKSPIDTRMYLSKAEMKVINDKVMPEKYFAICSDDGKLYLYNKNNVANNTSGKFISMDAVYASLSEFNTLKATVEAIQAQLADD